MRELTAPKYPRTRLYSQDYSTVLWDSDRNTGTAEEFLRASEFDWLPAIRDHTPGDRWSGRLVKNYNNIEAHRDIEYLKYLLEWQNPFIETGDTAE